MTDQDLNYAVAVRLSSIVDHRGRNFPENIENCREHMIPFLEQRGLQWSFCNHILAQCPAVTNVWAALKATPRQWCEAFLAATEHLAEKPKKAKAKS